MASSEAGDGLDREDEVEVFRAPVLLGREFGAGPVLYDRGIAADLDTVGTEQVGERGAEDLRDVRVDEHGLDGVADAGFLALAIDDDVRRHVEVAALVDVDVADAVVVLDDGHAGHADDALDEALAAARDDEVEILVHLRQDGPRSRGR